MTNRTLHQITITSTGGGGQSFVYVGSTVQDVLDHAFTVVMARADLNDRTAAISITRDGEVVSSTTVGAMLANDP